MYLTMSNYTISIVLFQHNPNDRQKFVYYVSKALVDVENYYSQIEQMALALRIAAKKPRPYFQAHQVTILTNQPLRVTLHKPNLSRQMIKWVIELSEYSIRYKPCLSLKWQVLADFIVELPQKRVQTDTTNHR